MPSLFDASALVNLIVSKGTDSLEIVKGQYILDLTLYEAGNALWKLSALKDKLSPEEADSMLGTIAKLAARMRIITVADLDLNSVMTMARGEKASFYDSSYIATAKSKNYLLVTDDRRLSRIASKHVEVKSSAQL